jgi:hypothetical protein
VAAFQYNKNFLISLVTAPTNVGAFLCSSLYLAIAMKNKWIYIRLIYVAAILLLAYEVVFAKKGTPQYYVAMVLYLILLAVYFIRRHRYIKRKVGEKRPY